MKKIILFLLFPFFVFSQESKKYDRVLSFSEFNHELKQSFKDSNNYRLENCKIEYNPNIISFQELLTVLFQIHDPTTLNRQGADKGTQYRSGIYYTSEEQKKIAEKYIKKLTEQNTFNDPIVTEIIELNNFYFCFFIY